MRSAQHQILAKSPQQVAPAIRQHGAWRQTMFWVVWDWLANMMKPPRGIIEYHRIAMSSRAVSKERFGCIARMPEGRKTMLALSCWNRTSTSGPLSGDRPPGIAGSFGSGTILESSISVPFCKCFHSVRFLESSVGFGFHSLCITTWVQQPSEQEHPSGPMFSPGFESDTLRISSMFQSKSAPRRGKMVRRVPGGGKTSLQSTDTQHDAKTGCIESKLNPWNDAFYHILSSGCWKPWLARLG